MEYALCPTKGAISTRIRGAQRDANVAGDLRDAIYETMSD